MSIKLQIRKKLNNKTLDLSFEMEKGITAILPKEENSRDLADFCMSCIVGLETPEEGRIAVGDHVIYESLSRVNLPMNKRRVGYLFPGCALFPTMTVEENVQSALLSGGRERIRQAAATLEDGKKIGTKLSVIRGVSRYLHEVGLDGLGGYYPGKLSPQQRIQAALARLLAASPRLILIGDAFGDLDPRTRVQTLQGIKRILTGEGIPAIYLAASEEEARAIGDQVILISDGKSERAKENPNYFDQPKSLQAALLGEWKNVSDVVKIDDYHARCDAWSMLFCKRKQAAAEKPTDGGNVETSGDAAAPKANENAAVDPKQNETPAPDSKLNEAEITGAEAKPLDAASDQMKPQQKKSSKEKSPADKWERLPDTLRAVAISEKSFRIEPDETKLEDKTEENRGATDLTDQTIYSFSIYDADYVQNGNDFQISFRPMPSCQGRLIATIHNEKMNLKEVMNIKTLYVNASDIRMLS